jgi:hypothetical protein
MLEEILHDDNKCFVAGPASGKLHLKMTMTIDHVAAAVAGVVLLPMTTTTTMIKQMMSSSSVVLKNNRLIVSHSHLSKLRRKTTT